MAPVVLALAGPAWAATVEVTPAPQGCGIVVTLTGHGDGVLTAVVGTTLLGSGEPVPVVVEPAEPAGLPLAPQTATPQPSGSPTLTAVRTVTGDGDAVVVLDAAAVPDADPRVVVTVTLDGAASPASELALPGCGPAPSGVPAPAGAETAPPTPAPAASPVPSASPSASPPPTASTGPTPTSVGPVASAPVSPVLTGAVEPVTTPAPDRVSSPVDVSGGSTGLSLMSYAAAPRLDGVLAAQPVPAPVVAAPEGSAAGLLAASEGTRSPLEDLLPPAPEDGDDAVTAQLAAPELTTDAADPLVDLAPAAFVLSASLGGLLVAGRRRTS